MMDSLVTNINQVMGSTLLQQYQHQQKLGIMTAAATLVTSYVCYKFLFKDIDYGCPVVPSNKLLNGSTEEYYKDPRGFVEKWTEKLGPVYRVHVFGRMHTVVSGKYVREIFLNNNFDFIAGSRKNFDIILLAGIPEGELTSESIRKMIVQHLTPNMKRFTPRVVENLYLGLNDMLGNLNEPKELDTIFPLVQRMVARGSASVFVGEELCQNKQVISILQTMTTDIGALHPRYKSTWLTGFPAMMKLKMKVIGRYSPVVMTCRRVLLEALTPEIDKRRSCANNTNWNRPDDMLQELIEHAKPPAENGTIVLYRLLQNPDLLNELLEEQQSVLTQEFPAIDPNHKQHGTNDDASQIFTADIIKKLTKLDSVCREALRLRSQFYELAHTNITNQNIVLSNGAVIPPDGDVLINFWHNHHKMKEGKSSNDTSSSYDNNSDYNDLAEFKPFRYVNTGYPSTKVGDAYLVFGEGKHACPGRWFAIQEIKTIISMLIRDYDIRAAGEIVFPIVRPGLPFGKVTIVKRNI